MRQLLIFSLVMFMAFLAEAQSSTPLAAPPSGGTTGLNELPRARVDYRGNIVVPMEDQVAQKYFADFSAMSIGSAAEADQFFARYESDIVSIDRVSENTITIKLSTGVKATASWTAANWNQYFQARNTVNVEKPAPSGE